LPVFIQPDRETDAANTFLLGSSSVGGSLPSSSQVDRRRRQFSLPSGSDCPPGQQITPRPPIRTRVARQTGFVYR
jgi:hypothetical protein